MVRCLLVAPAVFSLCSYFTVFVLFLPSNNGHCFPSNRRAVFLRLLFSSSSGSSWRSSRHALSSSWHEQFILFVILFIRTFDRRRCRCRSRSPGRFRSFRAAAARHGAQADALPESGPAPDGCQTPRLSKLLTSDSRARGGATVTTSDRRAEFSSRFRVVLHAHIAFAFAEFELRNRIALPSFAGMRILTFKERICHTCVRKCTTAPGAAQTSRARGAQANAKRNCCEPCTCVKRIARSYVFNAARLRIPGAEASRAVPASHQSRAQLTESARRPASFQRVGPAMRRFNHGERAIDARCLIVGNEQARNMAIA